MSTTRILFAGFGGQGILFAGKFLAYKGLIENKEVSWLPSYGPEMRGGTANCSVIISDEPIGYPNVETPDIILCLAQVAYDKYIDKFGDHTKIFYDTEMVKPAEGAKGEHIGYDFRAMSIELGNMQTMNTIALGLMMKRCGLLHQDSVMKAFAHRFAGKDKVVAINGKALELGLSLK